ncbi:polysaccharide deacetylase [Phycicoccus sp. SLBN-51]|nr:polysaccharide deacetylase [Phycicoccus sp. SLBN-51]
MSDLDALRASTLDKKSVALSPHSLVGSRPSLAIISRFQPGHGWRASTGSLSNLVVDDTSDYALGVQSLALATQASGVGGSVDSPISATGLNLEGGMVRLLIKVDDWSQINSLRLVAGDNTFDNDRNFNLDARETRTTASYVKDREWTWVTLNASAGSKSGTGATNVTRWRLSASSKAGGVAVVHLGAIEAGRVVRTFPNGVVSICFDDGRRSPYLYAKPKLDALGWSASAFPIIDRVSGTTSSSYLNATELRQCREYSGWEIGVHANLASEHNAGFDTLTSDEVEQSILASRQWFYDNDLGPGEGFAWPLGAFNKTVEAAARRLCAYGRLNTSWSLETWPPGNPMRIRSALNTTEYSKVRTMIDQTRAAGGWLCLTFHEVTPTGTESMAVSVSTFGQVLEYISDQGLAVLPMLDVIRSGSTAAPM